MIAFAAAPESVFGSHFLQLHGQTRIRPSYRETSASLRRTVNLVMWPPVRPDSASPRAKAVAVIAAVLPARLEHTPGQGAERQPPFEGGGEALPHGPPGYDRALTVKKQTGGDDVLLSGHRSNHGDCG